ncbi:hypothetical protein D039_2100A, partial [Vibrio parahaemolyticus EKP-028]
MVIARFVRGFSD